MIGFCGEGHEAATEHLVSSVGGKKGRLSSPPVSRRRRGVCRVDAPRPGAGAGRRGSQKRRNRGQLPGYAPGGKACPESSSRQCGVNLASLAAQTARLWFLGG